MVPAPYHGYAAPMERSDAPELLDGPLPDDATLRDNLRDLERVNRWLGGIAVSGRAIDALVGDRPEASILDVGTGGGDIPAALLDRAGRSGRRLAVTGIDSRPEILRAAIERRPSLERPGLRLELGDGRALPYPDRTFDVAHASLVAHHLGPTDLHALLLEMARVSRVGIVLNDLLRGRLAWLGAWLLAHLATRNRFTRHDGPLSVRRAYTLAELDDLLASAALRVEGRWFALARHRVAIAARVSP
jgi:SAM-dependent methyltransferase